ncbi:bifunctional 4-hydroxy-2-oxoglutarate aldolase/2-dehydro-3-deoxy-phosphogluconate aldolase [Parendozoicomonas sp. Alg238-R29]|uniref:bifunctional 4-hydroxy-2-oxoglutarate aldolase/2-dehydro-3-deoxy-phosphogluconate aldolase n=1 Tax=Parendozoicomonas sp. Alg238-R29 TaxID=2993446 RepID=UPI00248DD8DD|nr:bifunctional 4-hydroxy-2-oxoglutarate aldolase/2-dehydro-3-deoxy-phosphogluconate aldolase [Parendozoicomonas sp. Alg238-R29]
MYEKLKRVIDQAAPVMPVMIVDNIEQAVPMAAALREGGITVFEVTLRTECAIDAIYLLKKEFTDCFVGAGTVINCDQFRKVADAGADFIVSPGLSDDLLEAARDTNLSFLPGVSTASEVMQAMAAGFDMLKFFPAEQAGGVAMLKALSGPFGQVTFCPTGGIGQHNVADYLNLPNVACVGGSWLLPKEAVAANDWSMVTALAKEASSW